MITKVLVNCAQLKTTHNGLNTLRITDLNYFLPPIFICLRLSRCICVQLCRYQSEKFTSYSEREVFFEKNQKVTSSTTSLDRAEREVDGAGGGRGRVAVINKFDHITFSLNNLDNL